MTGGTVGSKLRDTGHASSDHDLVIRTASEIHAAHWQMSGRRAERASTLN